MSNDENPNGHLDEYEPPPETDSEPARKPQEYTPPVFLLWQASHPDWLPKPGESPCAICPQSLWTRAKITNRLAQAKDREEYQPPSERITQAFCRVMHSLSYASQSAEEGADGGGFDYVMSCDGPHIRKDKDAD